MLGMGKLNDRNGEIKCWEWGSAVLGMGKCNDRN